MLKIARCSDVCSKFHQYMVHTIAHTAQSNQILRDRFNKPGQPVHSNAVPPVRLSIKPSHTLIRKYKNQNKKNHKMDDPWKVGYSQLNSAQTTKNHLLFSFIYGFLLLSMFRITLFCHLFTNQSALNVRVRLITIVLFFFRLFIFIYFICIMFYLNNSQPSSIYQIANLS